MDQQETQGGAQVRRPARNTLAAPIEVWPEPAPREALDIMVPQVEELATSELPEEFAERWRSEARFFDEVAEKIAARLQPLDPRAVARYSKLERPWFIKEFCFQLLGRLRGKRVLDVGCGEGSNAVLMAKLGAHVTGVDISPGSIEVCRRRARIDGVEAQTQFCCSPLETLELPKGGFDIVWCDGVLHHVIPELDRVLSLLMRWARPGALFVLSEPVSLTPWLRRLRKGVPIHTDATPGERPLQRAELEIILRHLPGLEMKGFHLLGRLARFLLPGDYERSPLMRRLATDLLWRVDELLLSVPRLKPLGGMYVMYGRKPGSP
jgi:2-polyprenyl-3-methyl-5-hydroxy-6-metoxy-1,4-benzoquinol methylase